jgi:hypothetical protein
MKSKGMMICEAEKLQVRHLSVYHYPFPLLNLTFTPGFGLNILSAWASLTPVTIPH